ncbi:MobA/MobL family protein [Porphyrobacter sp. YT40]|uniref:MobA/MobL family protein n=1 Tax=Porphyrobacter sp. YT40 TaxID=2547601 RepID=UPI00114515FC|nr:MobA/MobL family protein [Porphyrobacter sp. YT40]QDH35118.1 hypothetical protein E2E27_12775 [Porphyrobacter sp. YT40]
MPKPKSSRSAVRNTPQPKEHQFVPAVFVDDFGRDRALTVQSARSFSKKKLNAAARARDRASDRAMERAFRNDEREGARHRRNLGKQEREADIARSRFFRMMRTKVRLNKPIRHNSQKPKRRRKSVQPSRVRLPLPKYDQPIRDKLGRRGVYFRVRYFGAKTTRPGVAMRFATYIFEGAELDSAGQPMWATNVGKTIEETVAGLDHLEVVNRSAQKNAKVIYAAELAMDHRWTPEQMLQVGERWAEERFGQFGLPYVIALHPPPPEGDERNWHLHAIWSWRPLQRTGDHEWCVGEGLRNELDGADGMRLLRERFAMISTAMSQEAGHCDVFTALSYAARGLPVEGQEHLGEVWTRRARAGELVPENEENHERVLRSMAALADDELRREDERLARQQDLLRRAAQRIAKVAPGPRAPSRAFRTARSAFKLVHRTWRTLEPAKEVPLIPAVPRRPSVPVGTQGRATGLKSLADVLERSKIANLRISAASPGLLPKAPTTRVFSTAVIPAIPKRTAARIITPVAKIAAPAPPTGQIYKIGLMKRPVLSAPAIKVPAREVTKTPRPPRQPYFTGAALLAKSVKKLGLALRRGKFANLRIAEASKLASVKVPSVPFNLSRMPRVSLRRASSPLPTSGTSPATLPAVPRRSFSVASIGPFAAPKVVPQASSSTRPIAPAPPSRRPIFAVATLGKVPRLAAILPLARPVARAPMPKPLAGQPSQPNRPEQQRQIALISFPADLFTRLNQSIERISAELGRIEDDDQIEEATDNRSRQPDKTLPSSDSPWLLLAILADRRSVIRKEKSGFWTVPDALLKEAGLTEFQAQSMPVQRALEKESKRQRTELDAVAKYLAADPQRHLVQTAHGWRLDASAPEELRRTVYLWRYDRAVQDTFEEFAKLPAVDAGQTKILGARPIYFASLVFKRSSTSPLASNADTQKEPSPASGQIAPSRTEEPKPQFRGTTPPEVGR